MTLTKRIKMNSRELAAYAQSEREKVETFFMGYTGELPNLGCEKIVNKDLFISTSLERLKQKHTSKGFISTINRLKKIKQHIENDNSIIIGDI